MSRRDKGGRSFAPFSGGNVRRTKGVGLLPPFQGEMSRRDKGGRSFAPFSGGNVRRTKGVERNNCPLTGQ